MEKITLKHLHEMIGSHEEITIINVLSHEKYQKEHIPGSKNIPFKDNALFVQQVESLVPSKYHKIILYCAGPDCSSSHKAGAALDQAGFSEVMVFEGGMKEWSAWQSKKAIR